MKLYMVPAAPNPTKVMLYIAEREVQGVEMGIDQVVVNTLKGRQREPEHLARNPFGTLPVLQLDDGTHLLESLSIIQYLDEKFPDNNMLGTDVELRAFARDLERTIEQRVTSAMGRYVHATNSPIGMPKDPQVALAAEQSLQPGLAYLSRLLDDGRQWLSGGDVSLADITLQAAVQFNRFAKVDLISDYANLVDWDQRYRQRPAAQRVLKF